MTRPDLSRQIIEIFPPAEVQRPNQWLGIAATIFFAVGVAVAVQIGA